MKLSEKGLKKLKRHEQIKKLGYVSFIDDIEFEPEDFTGAVVLTVDEVFTLKHMVQWVMKSSRLSGMKKVFLEKTYNFLNERFEQAEKP